MRLTSDERRKLDYIKDCEGIRSDSEIFRMLIQMKYKRCQEDQQNNLIEIRPKEQVVRDDN